jgi:Tol biopolymer transport system component
MKRCPECRRDYFDDSLLYCLDDGTALLEGPASGGGTTAILDSAGDAPTRVLDNGTTRASGSTGPRISFWLAAAAVAFIALVGGYSIYHLVELKKPTAQLPTPKITRITTSGKALEAAISPDGKWVVYAQKDGGQQSLWMRQTATNSTIQIVPPADVQIGRETFSPDGNYVYYFVTDASNPSGVLYQAPTIGGSSRKILSGIASPITFSPDGKQIAFIRNDEVATTEDQLIVANADGTGERKLAARKGDSWFGYPTGCGWSPDGRVIACSGGHNKTQFVQAVILTDAETGEEKDLDKIAFYDLGRISWLRDGGAFIVNAADASSQFDQLWSVAYPTGDAHRITNDLMEYGGTSLTADSSAMVSVQNDVTANIWTAPIGDLMHPKQITSGKLEGAAGISGGLSWTPDGRIVYASLSSGNADIWVMKSDGTEQKQLTSDVAVDVDPVASRDGRSIVFASNRSGNTGLWRMDLDGSNLRQLSDLDDHKPQISADSKWIIFDSWRSARRSLWKMPIDGGEAVQLTDKFTSSCGIAPDSSSIACFYRADDRSGSPWRIMVLPFSGGAPLKTYDVSVPDTLPLDASLSWTSDLKALTYVTSAGGIANLWSQSVDGGAPKKLTDFKENGVWRYALSNDNKEMAFSRGSSTSDVVLFKDFR